METRYRTILEAIRFYIDNEKYPSLDIVRGYVNLALNPLNQKKDGDQDNDQTA